MRSRGPQSCRPAECCWSPTPTPQWPVPRPRGKTRERPASPPQPKLALTASATPHGCPPRPRPERESPSSAKWKPADSARPARSSPQTLKDAPIARQRLRRESASSCWAFAIRKNGGCSVQRGAETCSTLEEAFATPPPFRPQTLAEIVSHPGHPTAAHSAEAIAPPRDGHHQ